MEAKEAAETSCFENFRGWTKPSSLQEKGDCVSEIYAVCSDISYLVLTGIHIGVF